MTKEQATQIPRLRIIWMIISIIIVIIYFQIMDAPFVYDDKIEVVGNRTIRFWEQSTEIFLYNPARVLLQFTYAYNFHVAQFDPRPYHLTNIGIHILCAGASIFALHSLTILGKVRNSFWFVTILSAWWTLHPMAIESVTYITGRSESLCALFALLAVGSKSKHIETQKNTWNILAWINILLACLVKEVGVALPLIFIVMEHCFAEKISRSTITAVILGGASFGLLRSFVVVQSLDGFEVSEIISLLIPNEVERETHIQLLTQMEVWIRYLGLWLFPYPQTIFHHLPDAAIDQFDTWIFTFGWIGVILGGHIATKNTPLARFAWWGLILVLMPSSSFAALQENMAEHRSHQMGWYLGICILSLLWKFWQPRLGLGFALTIILGLSIQTFLQNQNWKTEVRLWQHATLHNPESAKAWYGLGDAHRFAKQFNPALAAFSTCTHLDPNEMDCWNNLGITYAEMNNTQKAREVWLEALKQQSDYCKAHTNLGFLAYRQEQWDEALVEFRSTLVYCPKNVIAHYGLGLLYYSPRLDMQKAIHHFDQVLKLDPTFDYASDARQKLLDLTW